MSKKGFTFYPEVWLRNTDLRGCSPEARGFWLDVLALCFPSGYLVRKDGSPIDDETLARMLGLPVRLVRKWLQELGAAGIYSVSPDNRLFSSRMVKQAEFVAQARVAGERGQDRKKSKQSVAPRETLPAAPAQGGAPLAEPTGPTGTGGAPAVAAQTNHQRKSLDWWRTPAGWIRKANEQALSMKPEEAFADFQIRIAARIPSGRHLDSLTPAQMAAVESLRPKEPKSADKDEST